MFHSVNLLLTSKADGSHPGHLLCRVLLMTEEVGKAKVLAMVWLLVLQENKKRNMQSAQLYWKLPKPLFQLQSGPDSWYFESCFLTTCFLLTSLLHCRYIEVLKIRGRVDSRLSFPVVVVAVFCKAALKHAGTNDMAEMFPFWCAAASVCQYKLLVEFLLTGSQYSLNFPD